MDTIINAASIQSAWLAVCSAAVDADWHILLLDIIIIADFMVLAWWFHLDLTRRAFRIISVSFVLIILGKVFLILGDLFLALDYTSKDHWALQRHYRGLAWRYGSAVGFTAIVYQLIFGRFDRTKGDDDDKR